MVFQPELSPKLRSDGSPAFERLSLEQYHQMISTGILPEGTPIELIDGFLIRKDRSKRGENMMTVSKEHVFALESLHALLRLDITKNYARIQQPLFIPPNNEPDPDLVVLRGAVGAYHDAHPTPDDVLLLVEVADSSLSFDRKTKLTLYATAGIAHYWIVNLVNRQVEAHSQANRQAGIYSSIHIYSLTDDVPIPTGIIPALTIPVKAFMPRG